MQRLAIYLIFLYVCNTPRGLHAQQAKYTWLPDNSIVRIADKQGLSIHLWAVDGTTDNNNTGIQITVDVFSKEFLLTSEKKIVLPIGTVKSILFFSTDSCYYAHIFYSIHSDKRLVLRVSENGDMDTFTDSTAIANQHFVVPINYSNSLKLNNRFYYINKQSESSGNNNDKNRQDETLTVNKADIVTNASIAHQQFATTQLLFGKAFLSQSGQHIIASAFATGQKNLTGDRYLFLAWMDSSLNVLNNKPSLIKIGTVNNQLFIPINVHTVGSSLLTICNGLTTKTEYSYLGQSNGITAPPIVNQYYSFNSLRLILVNERQVTIVDTILNRGAERGKIDFDNICIINGAKSMDIFCLRKYTKTKNGILHLYIKEDGTIESEDMIVNAEYLYNLSSANKRVPGLLLVPYSYKRKAGLMRLLYKPLNTSSSD